MSLNTTAHHTRRERGGATTEAVEDYAKTIYTLAGRESGPVGTSALAAMLGVSPGTVTAMLKRMAKRGLVEYEPYRGVELTAAGERVALEVIRHHRLLEAYLADVLDMPWDRVHDEAEVLEHYISEDLERLIAEKLGDPSRDPHGDPIPSAELDIADDAMVPLAGLEPGDVATFERVSDRDAEMLRFLDERGIRPGCELLVRDRDPFDGPLFIEVGGREHVLGHRLATAMRVSRAGGGE
ncbi:MAG: DtxR family transcriptional regulator, Mn-dependent transcriptional regulator [Solirubrobacterales bacterium]|jgi:DtxR family Mn-dependent transcriptional regulator|nr:DtxR family transcriptional regulator, Mn-dependent transcriptional regulator [Solirubrobacterales bacterium]